MTGLASLRPASAWVDPVERSGASYRMVLLAQTPWSQVTSVSSAEVASVMSAARSLPSEAGVALARDITATADFRIPSWALPRQAPGEGGQRRRWGAPNTTAGSTADWAPTPEPWKVEAPRAVGGWPAPEAAPVAAAEIPPIRDDAPPRAGKLSYARVTATGAQ